MRKPDLHYQQVAEVYVEALEETAKADQAVAETWGVPISTAARWVKRARELGFLTASWAGSRCSSRCAVHCPSPIT